MEIKSKQIEMVEIDRIKENPKNANRHSIEQIERLEKLIKYQGFRNPLIVSNRSELLVVGHGRLMAARNLGMTRVPVIYEDFENEEQEYAYVISDNEIARWAELDWQSLYSELNDLELDDVDYLGIEDFKLPEVEKEPEGDENEIPEVEDAITKRGDVWLMGNHRLMCGDSTVIDDVEKLFNGHKCDITFTSPPYNIGKSIRGNMYENNDDNTNEYLQFLIDWTNLALTFTDFVFHNNQLLENNKRDLIKYQSHFVDQIKDILIWNKKQHPPHINPGTFGTKWEYVMAMANDGKSRGFPCSWQGKYSNVIETNNNSKNEYADIHKAGFPIEFPEFIIETMDFAQSLYDPFMGTGTSLIACEKHHKKSYGMELDEKYCDVIINRWQNYTGEKAILESSGEFYDELK